MFSSQINRLPCASFIPLPDHFSCYTVIPIRPGLKPRGSNGAASRIASKSMSIPNSITANPNYSKSGNTTRRSNVNLFFQVWTIFTYVYPCSRVCLQLSIAIQNFMHNRSGSWGSFLFWSSSPFLGSLQSLPVVAFEGFVVPDWVEDHVWSCTVTSLLSPIPYEGARAKRGVHLVTPFPKAAQHWAYRKNIFLDLSTLLLHTVFGTKTMLTRFGCKNWN